MCDNIYIGTRVLRVLTIWRRLRKNVAIKEEAMTAESQIVDELNFTPIILPGSVKITFIPKYIKYFDSFKDLQAYKEYLPYKKVKGGIEVRRHKKRKESAGPSKKILKITPFVSNLSPVKMSPPRGGSEKPAHL